MSIASAHAARAFANLLRVAGETVTITPVDGTDIEIEALCTGPGQQPASANLSIETDTVDLVMRVSQATLDAAMAAQSLTARAPGKGDLVEARGVTYGVISGRVTAGGEYRCELRSQRLTGLGAAFGS